MRISEKTSVHEIGLLEVELVKAASSPAEIKFYPAVLHTALRLAALTGAELELKPQAEIGAVGRRVDWLLRVVSVGGVPLHESFAIEIDGFAFHADQRAFADDRKRDRELMALGIRTVRFTAKQAAEDLAGCESELFWLVVGIIIPPRAR